MTPVKPILKTATTFGATRALLGQMRSQGVQLARKPEQLENPFMAAMGPHYNPQSTKPSIFVPRGGMGRGFTPRNTFFHEAGHAMDPNVVRYADVTRRLQKHLAPRANDIMEKAFSPTVDPHPSFLTGPTVNRILTKAQLNTENAANTNAMSFMQQHNVPQVNIDSYLNMAGNGFRSYRDNATIGFLSERQGVRDMAANPEISKRMDDVFIRAAAPMETPGATLADALNTKDLIQRWMKNQIPGYRNARSQVSTANKNILGTPVFNPVTKVGQDNQKPVSDSERFLALKALREYLFLKHPSRYASSDFIEDIPQLRPYSSFAHDLLPSAAVISPNQKKREGQIAEAVQGIKGLHKGHNLPKEMATGAATMGASSIPVSLLFGTLSRLATHGKAGFTNPVLRSESLKGLGKDVAGGVTLGTAFGAATPLVSHAINPRQKALTEAADILQKAPYTSGIPGGDVFASYNYKKKKDKEQLAKSTALGTAIGAGAGASGKLLHSANEVATSKILRTMGMAIPKEHFHVGNIGKPTLVGAGLGAGLGLLTSALLPSKY